MVQPRLKSRDEAAAFGGEHETHLLGSGPLALVPGRRVEPIDLMFFDVDEPQRVIALDPHRTYAKLGGEIPDVLGLARGHFNANLHPRNIRDRSFPWHRP